MLDEDYLSSLEKTHPTLLARTPTGTWSGGFGMPQFRIICLRLLVCACVCVLAPGRFVVGILGPHSPSFALRCPKLVPLVLWNKTSHETLQPTKIWGQPWFNHPSWCGDYTPQIEIEMGPVYEPKLEVLCMNHSFGGSKWKKHTQFKYIQIRSTGLDIWIVGSVEKGGWIGLCLGLLQLLSTNFPYPWRGWCGLPEYCTPNWDPTQLGDGVDRNFRPQLRTVPSQGPRSNTQLNQPTKIHL